MIETKAAERNQKNNKLCPPSVSSLIKTVMNAVPPRKIRITKWMRSNRRWNEINFVSKKHAHGIGAQRASERAKRRFVLVFVSSCLCVLSWIFFSLIRFNRYNPSIAFFNFEIRERRPSMTHTHTQTPSAVRVVCTWAAQCTAYSVYGTKELLGTCE